MKLIIAGSRTLNPKVHEIAEQVSKFYIPITEVISGGARGVDTCAEKYALASDQPMRIFHAEWDKYGKRAGYIRNKAMADYADALLLIWDGESKGSKNMKETMQKLNKPVYECILSKEEQ